MLAPAITEKDMDLVALAKNPVPSGARTGTFKAHDGLELSGWLYRPAGTAPFPTVLSFHGGPEGQERPIFNSTYQALLSRGIAVFAPNVRGSSGFGKRFVNLDNGQLPYKLMERVLRGKRHATRIMAMLESERQK